MERIRWTDYVADSRTVCVPTWIGGSPRYAYPPHDHAGQTEVMVVLEGRLRHQINGATRFMARGDAAFVAESDIHSLAASGSRVLILNLAFPTSFLWSPAAAALPPGRYGAGFEASLPIAELARFGEYGEALTYARGADATPILVECLLWLARVTARGLTAEPETDRSTEWFAELVAWAAAEREKVPTVAELAARSGRSPEHLCRCFRAFRSQTPTEFVNGLRVARAKILLARSNWPIVEVCWASGFESLGRFYAVFKRAVGVAPASWRARAARSPYAR